MVFFEKLLPKLLCAFSVVHELYTIFPCKYSLTVYHLLFAVKHQCDIIYQLETIVFFKHRNQLILLFNQLFFITIFFLINHKLCRSGFLSQATVL